MSYPILDAKLLSDEKYRNDLAKAIDSNNLYVKVVRGPLNGTFGKFVKISTHYWDTTNGLSLWDSYRDDPLDFSLDTPLCLQLNDSKIVIDCGLPDKIETYVMVTSCEWEFGKVENLKKLHLGVDIGSIMPNDVPVIYDSLGAEIKVGGVCSYIAFGHRTGGAQLYYGNVTRITRKGEIYCTDMKVGKYDPGGITGEKKLRDVSCITMLDEKIMNRLVMARLSK